MAMSASSSCAQAVTNVLTSGAEPGAVPTSGHPRGVIPLPAKPTFEGTGLRRKKSLRPVSAGAREASVDGQSLESAVSQAVSKVGEEIVTTSGEILDVVMEDGHHPRRKGTGRGRANSRTSRRRALVMCLALGMVRPCTLNLQQGSDLRRTVSEAIQRTASSSFQVPATLVSQVSLATTVKQTTFMGQPEDLQKLTTLQ